MQFETENIEFKAKVTDDLYKEVIAFANSDGGVIYIGIADDGTVTGLENVDEAYTRITNGIRDAIMPDVTMFIRYTLHENRVIRITVGEGSYKPYYLRAKGLKPNGVYIRQGASSAPASPEQIRQMIKESDGDVYESMRSMNQELTFESAKRAFARYGVEFSEEKYRALGITDPSDELYTNMALILSDQCQHTVKLAVFADDANTEFRVSREFSGSVMTQLEEAFSYLMLCNRNPSQLQGLVRVEMWDYPEAALREALLNALVHRDYSFSGSVIINVNEQMIEFISIGGLLPGLSPEDIKSGISQPRNRNLAEVFHRLHLIESYGTGIRRIFAMYRECEMQPRIEVTANTFKMILPNMNAGKEEGSKSASARSKLTDQKQVILDYITKHGQMTDEQIQQELHLKRTRAYTIVKQMREEGLIVVNGRGAGKKYLLP